MTDEDKFLSAVKELRKTQVKRTFDQSVDIIVNLREFDVRRESFNTFIRVPHKIKERKIAAFLEKDSKAVDTIKKEEFPRYKEKKDLRRLVKSYDFFISSAKLMPAVATTFGRALGPAGKMPNPQLGIITSEDDNNLKQIRESVNSTVKIRVKEPSIKAAIGKQSSTDEQLAENAIAVYNKLIEILPKGKENIGSILIKLSMDKPVKVL
jgi:large subunit ribosomal protein L1